MDLVVRQEPQVPLVSQDLLVLLLLQERLVRLVQVLHLVPQVVLEPLAHREQVELRAPQEHLVPRVLVDQQVPLGQVVHLVRMETSINAALLFLVLVLLYVKQVH